MPNTWSWMISTCFGKERASEEADRRRHTNKGINGTAGSTKASNGYGATTAAPAATSSTTAAPLGAGKASKDPWGQAIHALLEDIDKGTDPKLPSFNWRHRLNYGSGATCIGPEGARRFSALLLKKIRDRKESIARLTQQLSATSGREEPVSAFVGLTSSSAVGTPSASSASQQQPVSPRLQQGTLSVADRASLLAQLATLESTPPHSIKQLDLRGQEIGDSGVEAIADLIAEDTFIEILILSKNHLTSRGVIDLAKGLQQNQASLKRLVISENDIDSRGVVALCRVIKTQQLQHPVATHASNGAFASTISHSYVSSSSVNGVVADTSLNNTTMNDHLVSLAPPITATTSEFANTTNGLVELEIGFGQCALNDDAGMALRDACFSGGSNLRSIKITSSPKAFTVASLGAVLRGLAQNRRLVSLTFNGCIDEQTLSGPNGARPFLEPFATGALCRADSPLRLLEITNIAIGDVGARVIADALRLRTAAHLRTLTLTRCAIGAVGFESLGAMVEANPYLTRLDLSGNLHAQNRSRDTAEEGPSSPTLDITHPLILSLTRNATLQELFIADYRLSKASVAALTDYLAKGNTSQGRRVAGKLRTVRFGSADAPDSLVTRLHNLLTENTESYIAEQKDNQEKQQQQQQQAANNNNNARRAVVSFTSGGVNLEPDYSTNAYASPSSQHFRKRSASVTSGGRGVPTSPTSTTTNLAQHASRSTMSNSKSPSARPERQPDVAEDGVALDKIHLDF